MNDYQEMPNDTKGYQSEFLTQKNVKFCNLAFFRGFGGFGGMIFQCV